MSCSRTVKFTLDDAAYFHSRIKALAVQGGRICASTDAQVRNDSASRRQENILPEQDVFPGRSKSHAQHAVVRVMHAAQSIAFDGPHVAALDDQKIEALIFQFVRTFA